MLPLLNSVIKFKLDGYTTCENYLEDYVVTTLTILLQQSNTNISPFTTSIVACNLHMNHVCYSSLFIPQPTKSIYVFISINRHCSKHDTLCTFLSNLQCQLGVFKKQLKIEPIDKLNCNQTKIKLKPNACTSILFVLN